MGGKPRKKPRMAPSAETVGGLERMHNSAIQEMMESEDREVLALLRGYPLHGLNAHRVRREPLEARFAEVWAKENSADKRAPLLAHLLSDGSNNSMPPIPSDRDWQVANTVIQWLGSSVGQSFLEDVDG